MAEITPYLKLYKPGGGSSGHITPDERVDVDRLNTNSDLIDAEAKDQADKTAALESRNQQFYGPAADRASLTGVKPGDTYQESDSNKMQWEQTAGGLWRVLNSNREIDLTLASGWNSGAQPARFEVRNGYLSFNGRISGSAGAGEVITTLPVDYRPSRERAMSFFDMTTIRDLVLGADGDLRNHGKGSASVVDLRLATVAPFPIK